MFLNYSLRVTYITLIILFVLNSCVGQVSESFSVESITVHQDSISSWADTLPEYRVGVNDQDYQGNQISGVIRTVYDDSKGNIWFGTQSGLCRYNKDGLFYFNLVDGNNNSVTIHAITADAKGNIWVGYGGGIAKFDGSNFTMYHQKDILKQSSLWSMTMDKKGLLWIGTTDGVYTFDGSALTPFAIPEGKQDSSLGVSSTKMVHSIIEDSQGNMWFGTNAGAFIYDGNRVKNISDKDGIQTEFVNKIVESSNGHFWISTSKGLFKYDGKSVINLSEKALGKGVGVACAFEDSNGLLWFSANKRDIYNYNGKTFTKIHINEGDISPFPFEISQDKKDRLWFVGLKGAYRLEDNKFINVTRDGPW